MHSTGTNRRTKGRLNISDVGPRFGSKKLAAGSKKLAVGVCAIRAAMALAVISTLLLIAARPAQAQTETVLYNFTGGSDGADPMSLSSDGAGNFYGTTYRGGLGYGTVFELSPNGSGGWNETVLYSFTGGEDGSNLYYSPVILDSVGNLYGTTLYGGAYGLGVVFELNPVGGTWTETVLHSFAGGADGAYPTRALIMDPEGNLYGAASGGGRAYGIVFELSPSGGGWTEQVIYTEPKKKHGGGPNIPGLTMDAAGNIFGVGSSTVFELSPNGNDGWNPTVIRTRWAWAYGNPVLDKAGNIYGTKLMGGAHELGTVYKLSPGKNGWTGKTLHNFEGGEDGSRPIAGIVLDADGNLYGTTTEGGGSGAGIVYELVPPVGKTGSYKEKILWSFNGTDGLFPAGSLILDNAGNLYGTTNIGGSSSYGVVFEVSGLAVITTTTLTSSPNPSTHGQAVTFTAVVTSSVGAPPDGETVAFMKGKKVLGTGSLSGGSASFTTSTLKVGTTTVTAVYGGDLHFIGSTSDAVKQVVEKAGK